MKTHTLVAEQRSVTGRKVKKLRAAGVLPANIYGKKVDSVAISVPQKDFMKLFEEAGETGLIEITVGKEKRPALIHNVQFHPVDGSPLHVDFLQVDLKEKVTAQVPVVTIGESPAEKQGGATAVLYLREVEVESLPGDLPESFEVDLSELTEIDAQIAVKDLKYDKTKIKISQSEDEVVVKVEAQKVEEESQPAVSETATEEGTAESGSEGESEEKPANEEAGEKPQE